MSNATQSTVRLWFRAGQPSHRPRPSTALSGSAAHRPLALLTRNASHETGSEEKVATMRVPRVDCRLSELAQTASDEPDTEHREKSEHYAVERPLLEPVLHHQPNGESDDGDERQEERGHEQ